MCLCFPLPTLNLTLFDFGLLPRALSALDFQPILHLFLPVFGLQPSFCFGVTLLRIDALSLLMLALQFNPVVLERTLHGADQPLRVGPEPIMADGKGLSAS